MARRKYFVRALTYCDVYMLHKDDLEDILEVRNPGDSVAGAMCVSHVCHLTHCVLCDPTLLPAARRLS